MGCFLFCLVIVLVVFVVLLGFDVVCIRCSVSALWLVLGWGALGGICGRLIACGVFMVVCVVFLFVTYDLL